MVKNITAWVLIALPLGSIVAVADPLQTHIVHPVYYHVRTIGGVERLAEAPAFAIGFAAPAAIGDGFADPTPTAMKAGLLTPKPLAPAQGFGHAPPALPLAETRSGARIPLASMAAQVQ